MLEPEPWLEGFEALDFPEDVQRKILWENAESFLDL
jgi:predicted TIM-barrel fold metal-dependent hydrolase